MAKYEFTEQQVQNMRAFLMDANIKGSAAVAVVELMGALSHPVEESKDNDLHREHNDTEEHCAEQS